MKLSNGSEIVVDLEKISIKEWRFIWKSDTDEDLCDEILGRVVGMSRDEIQSLSIRDYQRIVKQVRDASRIPIPDEDTKN